MEGGSVPDRHQMDRNRMRPVSRGRRIHASLDRAAFAVEKTLNAAAGWLILALMALLVVVVIGRSLFDQPVRGQVDFVQMAVPSFAFLGLAYCFRLAGHVRMDIVLRGLSGRPRIAAELVGALVALVISVILVIGTFRDTSRAYRFGDTTMDIQILTWPARAVICIGLALFALRMTLTVWGWARALLRPNEPPIGVPVAPDDAEVEGWIEPPAPEETPR